MSNFLKPIGLVVIAALTTTLSFGQTKQQTVPNLTSPFQNKTVKSSSTVILQVVIIKEVLKNQRLK